MKIYQIDAFADRVFSGNPAAVCPLDEWLSEEVMLKIAGENNLSETAFYVKHNDGYEIRWFTPRVEVALCGHATLATAYVLFNHEGHRSNSIRFFSRHSGILTVSRGSAGFLTLDFPADTISEIALRDEMLQCFDQTPKLAFKGRTDFVFVFDNERQIRDMKPVFGKIAKLDARGVVVTAKGEHVDFVSRFFAPKVGVNEDPVTGSAHTSLVPFWAKELNKTELTAIQLSERKGYLRCKHVHDRVEISGQGRLYLKGEVQIDDKDWLCRSAPHT